MKRSLWRATIAQMLLLAAAGAVVAADPRAPAEFRVTNVVHQPDPGAFSATIAEIPGDRQLFSGGAFEPLVFRTKFAAAGDADDEVLLPAQQHDAFGTFRTGFWDGAEVRVYRARDGRLVKVREDRVPPGGYVAEGWLPMSEMRDHLVAPGATEAAPDLGGAAGLGDLGAPQARDRVRFRSAIGAEYRPSVTYYFCVRAVAAGGAESSSSNAASVTLRATTTKAASAGNLLVKLDTRRGRAREPAPAAPAPPVPRDFRAALDADGVATLSWQPVRAAGLMGYRVYVSEYAPDQQRGNHLRLAGKATDAAQHVKTGDLVFVSMQRDNFSRIECVHGCLWHDRRFDHASRLIGDYPDERDDVAWARVPHPGPLPADFTDGGETCLRLDLKAAAPYALGMYAYAGTSQTWYPVLQPGRTYVVEGWLRYHGEGGGRVRFHLTRFYDRPAAQGGVPAAEFRAEDRWQHFRTTFSPGYLVNERGAGRIEFEFTGPGTFWVDNLRVYADPPGYLKPEPVVVERGRASGLEALRFHTHIKSRWGNTMAMLTNAPGVIGDRGNERPNAPFTLPALLGFCHNIGANPWLQVEMNMSEREWLGLVEYLAAPYDPAVDTPAKKPWAAKRFAEGQARPWTDEFDRVWFEISNETWNGLFGPWNFGWGQTMTDEANGRVYRWGELYGLVQEYVLGVLRSSPYWQPGPAEKLRPVMGGWAIQTKPDGYGALAVRHSPSTRYLTVGGYNGGWDEGEQPAEPTNSGYFRALTYWPQAEARTREDVQTRDELVAQGLAHRYDLGAYEAGPGYALSGLNNQPRMTPEQVEAQDRVGKSLAMGTATLDAFLGRAYLGFKVQGFFTFNFARSYWTSHAPVRLGGWPYPSWEALSLYNTRGAGDFLTVEARSVPTTDLTGYKNRRARKDAPLVAVYATRRADRVNVFVLSRKLDGFPDAADDGFTPVTIELPFTRARTVTLYKMSGDPRAHNLDSRQVKVIERANIPFAAPFRLTRATTGEARDGLPPGSVLLYMFDGVTAVIEG